MSNLIRVCTPCRLHFGMFSFGHSGRPQFGGVGVMVEPPCVEVELRPADRFDVAGDHVDRVQRFVEMACHRWHVSPLPRCRIRVSSPPNHIGLGVGTQLGLALAAGLRQIVGLPVLPVEELATSVGRSRRSAVGTYGFDRGGLIVDSGLDANSRQTRLVQRIAIPATWRFVLIRPSHLQGLAGDREVEAFAGLPAVPFQVTDELWRITEQEIVPAVKAADCEAFGEAVYRFGHLAGECFAAVQGGPFASREVASLVAAIRKIGVAGVGQSSWGPTVFAAVADDASADSLVHWLQNEPSCQGCEVTIARPNNCGARFGPRAFSSTTCTPFTSAPVDTA